MTNKSNEDGGFHANISGSCTVSEKAVMAILSTILSILSFAGGYNLGSGSQKAIPIPDLVKQEVTR